MVISKITYITFSLEPNMGLGPYGPICCKQLLIGKGVSSTEAFVSGRSKIFGRQFYNHSHMDK